VTAEPWLGRDLGRDPGLDIDAGSHYLRYHCQDATGAISEMSRFAQLAFGPTLLVKRTIAAMEPLRVASQRRRMVNGCDAQLRA
jgi:hypothetical protein